MFVFFSFFLHGALKLEGFQRIRDVNAREVIMLVVQVKYKMEVDACFWGSFFIQQKSETNYLLFNRKPVVLVQYTDILSNTWYLWSCNNFKIISKKCIHFQSLLSTLFHQPSSCTSSTECIKRNFRFLWSMTRHTFWTSWIERSKQASRGRVVVDVVDVVDACWRRWWWWFHSESLCIIEAPEAAGGDFLICQLAMCFW